MSKYCTSCYQEACECDQTVTFEELSYTNADFEVPEVLERQLLSTDTRAPESLRAWQFITGCKPTGTNVRKAVFWVMSSIQTRTAVLDEITQIDFNNFQNLKEAVESSTDGEVKWEKLHAFWNADTADNVADSARADDWIDAVADLSGLTKADESRHEGYLRVVKANLVAEILGDPDALCLDSARRSALEPLFDRMFDGVVTAPDTPVGDAPYRSKSTPVTAETVLPRDKKFLEDRLTKNPAEYRAIAKKILDSLQEATGMDRRRISHALFVMGNADGATEHESLAEMLD